ncbi:MAG: reverse transcriptase domain-containing protein [Pseudomonadota bacterium]|nr:reverse transcriptase domain-containing protein [Pseudomonadota bacterium]
MGTMKAHPQTFIIITGVLRSGIDPVDLDRVKKTVGGGKSNRKGTPQGGVISPLLANCYMHILDRLWQRRHLKGKLQAHLVRYADDFVVMCRKGCRGTAEGGAPRAGTTGPQSQRGQDACGGCHPSELQLPGIYDSDESRREYWKAVPECQAGRQVAEEDQGETDGTDATGTDRHPLGRRSRKCEPQPARLGELISLSELKSGDEQGQGSMRKTGCEPT